MNQLKTVKELAEVLGVNVKTIYDLVKENKLPSVKIGRHIRFEIDQVKEWVRNGGTK